jgi:hypothetical protein
MDEEQERQIMLGEVLDQITDSIVIYPQTDGDIAVSIHTIDLLNNILLKAVEAGMDDQEDYGFTEDTAFGAAWVMGIYQAFHDAVEMKSASHNVPDDISELTGEAN